MFWASTPMSEPASASTAAWIDVKGTHRLTWTPSGGGRSAAMYSRVSAAVLYIFQLPATYGRLSGIVERLDPGERLAFEQLERSASAGRHVRYPVGHPEAHESRRRVAAPDHGRTGRRRDRLGDSPRPGGERLELEGSHRAVPEGRAGGRDALGVAVCRLGADVQAHPTVRHRGA